MKAKFLHPEKLMKICAESFTRRRLIASFFLKVIFKNFSGD